MAHSVTAEEERKEERSPFTAVRIAEQRVIVVFQQEEVELVSINDLPTDAILSFCRRSYGDRWEKRFAEDLVEVLTRMGNEPGETVKLVVRNPKTGKLRTVGDAPMTPENRKQVWQARRGVKPLTPHQDFVERSPFTEVVFQDARPVVTYEGKQYELRSINGLTATRIVDFCQQNYGERWKERFAEDLVQVLTGVGKTPGDTVSLILRDLESDKPLTIAEAPMTEENRRQVRQALDALESRRSESLLPEEMLADLEVFGSVLRERWSYYHATDADFDAAIAELRAECKQPIPRHEFARRLMRLVALGIDGHASVSHVNLPEGFAPFLVEPCGDRFVAFSPDRTGFLDDEHPFIDQLEGLPLQDWLDVASELVPRGSPQFVRRHSLRYLRHVTYMRQRLNMKNDQLLAVRLVSREGASTREIKLPVADKRPSYGIWPQTKSRILNGNIGYLRLTTMSERSVRDIRRWMGKFRDTRGLIIDVRDNGGGTREPLRTLSSYLVANDDTPRVVNVARYRLHPDREADHLKPRFLFPADSAHWSDAERKAITTFAAEFRPRWTPSAAEFSPPHYMVLSRISEPGVYHYDHPVVVLMNEKCFSATDVFLAALKGCRNVTLVGTPSGGGSARSEIHKLPHSDIEITVGSMVSWQANGQLFDGHGVQPDIVVNPGPEYFIGGTVDPLASAVKMLENQME